MKTVTVDLSEREYKKLEKKLKKLERKRFEKDLLYAEETKNMTLPERWDHPRNRKLIENYIPWGDLSPVEKVFIQDCHCLGRPKPYTGMVKVERDRKFKVTYVTLMVRTDGKDQQGRK